MTLRTIFYLTFSFLIPFSIITTHAQNVQIIGFGNPTEPSIMMDPKNTNHLVAGANSDYYFNSLDGGLTWTANTLTSSFGVWGDPCIDVDTSSNFYFFHLSNPPGSSFIDRIVCQKSTDNGVSWNDGTFTGLNGAKVQDKHWSVIDRNNNNIYLTWTQFDAHQSDNPLDSSIILFSKSIDAGNSWSPPKRISKYAGNSLDDSGTVEGAIPAVGPNGEVYVSWAGPEGIVFNKSTDEGETWLTEEINVNPMLGGWHLSIPGIYRCNGFPVIKCDLSGGPNHGTIYINWSDQSNGSNDTDIWLSKSTDGGETWSDAKRVNNDAPGSHQFFTWMDIDQTNGNLHFVFYDRRAYYDNRTDVYLATSIDGGLTFINKKISESPFTPDAGAFFGDYTNITVHNNIIRPIWTRLDVNLSIWTNVTPLDEILSTPNEIIDKFEISQYPTPSNQLVYMSFKLQKSSQVSIEIYDQSGKIIYTKFNKEIMTKGKHIIPINLSELKLPAGTYFHKLTIDGNVKTQKNIIVN